MSGTVVFPQSVLDAVRSHPDYAARRREAEQAHDAAQVAAVLMSMEQTGDAYEAVLAAQREFMAAQAHVTELYDVAFKAHQAGLL